MKSNLAPQKRTLFMYESFLSLERNFPIVNFRLFVDNPFLDSNLLVWWETLVDNLSSILKARPKQGVLEMKPHLYLVWL